jgi:glycosyltransferase involved in cell wall biosynthesis
VVTPRYPYPALRGDQRRLLHIVTGLALHTAVTLVTFGHGPPLPGAGRRVRVVTVQRGLVSTIVGNAAVADPRLPGQVRLYLDARMRRAVAREVRRGPAPVLHVALARMAPYLDVRGAAHRHLDLVDPLALNMRERAAHARGPERAALLLETRLMRRYEARAAAAADSCSVVSADDLVRAPELRHATVVPNGVDTAAFPFRAPRERPPVLVFFGNLGYFPNEAAARLVAEQVLPPVRARRPAARLRLAGHRPSAAVQRLARLDGVEVMGPVASMAPVLHEAAVALIPMTSGTGMKNKLLEAFSAGTPVVTNPKGTLGLEGVRDGHHLLIGRTPHQLAEACIRLLDDPGARVALAQAARELVETRYSWESQIAGLLELYGG